MPMQMRPANGGIAYAPHRDLGFILPGLFKVVIRGLPETNWNYLIGDYLRSCNTTEQDLIIASARYVAFIKLCADPSTVDMAEAMEKSEFTKSPVPAQMAVLTKLGEIVSGYYFTAVRDACNPREVNGMLAGLPELLEEVAKLNLYPLPDIIKDDVGK